MDGPTVIRLLVVEDDRVYRHLIRRACPAATRNRHGATIANKPVVVNGPHSKRSVPPMPRSHGEGRICNKVRSAVYINPVIATSTHYRSSSVHRSMKDAG